MFLIIDDNEQAGKRLESYLRQLEEETPEICRVVLPEKALEIAVSEPVELLFLDIELPGTNGFDLWEEMRRQGFTGHVVCTTVYDTYILQALRQKALDYLLKPIEKKELEKALQRFKNQEHIRVLNFTRLKDFDLTPRQIEICRMMIRGNTTKEIAEQLFLSEHTVSTHRKNILRATGCRNPTDIMNLL